MAAVAVTGCLRDRLPSYRRIPAVAAVCCSVCTRLSPREVAIIPVHPDQYQYASHVRYVYLYILISIYLSTYLSFNSDFFIFFFLYVIYLCMYICIYIYIYIFLYALYVYVSMYIRIYTYVYVCIHLKTQQSPWCTGRVALRLRRRWRMSMH